MPSILAIVMTACALTATTESNLATVAQNISSPPKEYSSGPLWVWNDMLTEEMVRDTLDSLADQHIRQVWVHPRPGLMTPYLSEDWFKLWGVALEKARERDMLIWIYDENSYPSCFAGGLVPEAMPESRALGLSLGTERKIPSQRRNVIGIYQQTDTGYTDITDSPTPANANTEVVVARISKAKSSPWYGGWYHTDLLRPGVTEKFLEITLDAYRKHFGDEFGKRIPGSFTDEPHLKPCGDIHWTPDLPEQFLKRWGRSIREGLPYLKDNTEAGRQFRYEYFQLINELFVERWAKPYYAYCEKYNMDFTGHYWEHSWPRCASVPDNMAMSAWQQRPGIDILFNQYAEGAHAQFGNVRAVLELASVANQCGHKRTLCEVYGGSSAEMRFEDYKRIGDWIAVLGVNTFNEHLSDISIRGARKRDYPPTFSYHSPWMESYHVLVDYFARVQYLLSQGEQINTCLVLEPTTTAWMHHFADEEHYEALGESFQALVTQLAQKQVEFDIGSESIMSTRGEFIPDIDGKPAIKVGNRCYTVILLPEQMENLTRPVFELLKQYVEAGGAVLSCAAPALPAYIDGQRDTHCADLRKAKSWKAITPAKLAESITALNAPQIKVTLAGGNKATLYHHRRQLSDGDILFLVNTSNENSATGEISTMASSIRKVNLETGAIQLYPCESSGKEQKIARFDIPPCGSLMLFLDDHVVEAPSAPPAGKHTPIEISDVVAQRLDENHLILDYVDLKVGDTTAEDLFWRNAAELTFKKNGLRGNIWDHCVQFRDELLKTEFDPNSGFEATYHFTIEEAVPQTLFAVVERADLYSITCNGIPVTPIKDAWWLDRQFLRIDIAKIAQVGKNTLTIAAKPMTVFHELEAAHLIGDFALKPAEKGFIVTPSKPVGVGEWTAQGMPLYGHRVSYTAKFTAAKEGRHFLSMPAWNGVVAQVRVNGSTAGYIYHAPMECDITDAIQPGENTVEIIICGSLRNTLGPHLGRKNEGITHPGSWNRAPESPQPSGATYFSIGYGLLAPFQVTYVNL